MRLASILILSSLVATPLLTGCSGSSVDAPPASGEEQDLVKSKVLVRNVSSPSGLIAAGGYVYFGANKFVASGDPELDQQFAYWTGKFSRVPVAGGAREIVEDLGPIARVQRAGTKLLYGRPDGCWINSIEAAGAVKSSKEIYREEECDPEVVSGIAGFNVADDKLVIAHYDGEILVGSPSGAGVKKVGAVKIGDWGDIVSDFAVADGNAFILTRANIDNRPVAIHKVALATGKDSKVVDFETRPSALHSDGKNLYIVDGANVLLLTPGSSTPKTIASGFENIAALASDGKDLFVADFKLGAIFQIVDATGGAPTKRKLASVKDIQELSVSEGTLYYGSGSVENRKPSGVIGALVIPH